MEHLAGLEVRELADWASVECYAASGSDYILVFSEDGTGLFHSGDVAQHAVTELKETRFPLYIFSDERGEAPLISVEDDGSELLIAALFSTSEKARAFHERASHLDLPDTLGTIEDAGGLRRHALVAREAGAEYAVIDPESGLTEAIPLEEWAG
jgi:hypothetical protein